MSPEQFLEFASVLPEPLFLIAGNGQILAANPASSRMLGIPRQILQEKMLFELAIDPPARIEQYLRNCSSSREMVLGSLTLRANNGTTCLYRSEGAVIRPWLPESPALILLRLKDRESASSRFTLLNKKIDELSKEIHQRKRVEQERTQLLMQEQKARAEAEKLSRLKDEFLSTVSHELRTPLNAILGWSQILQSNRIEEKTRNRALNTIERSARSQVQLIDDLLDISRIITNKIRLDFQTVELLPIIEAAIDTIRPTANAKNIQLRSVLEPADSAILGDYGRLQQIFWNLLSNAVKFTPKHGRVWVSLRRINSHVEIIVADTGQGISAEFLPYVFDRFRQADSSITRSFGGLGLGLALVRQLVELHGGTVHAESPGEGQGATFIVKLPLMAVSSKAIESERFYPAMGGSDPFGCSPRLDGLRILIVDDDTGIRDLLTYILEVCGAEVRAVASADEAISALTETSLSMDILISDIGMPNEDGYTLLRRIRTLESEKGGTIPAIALTAYAGDRERKTALSAGFQYHVAKPVEPTELIAAIASLAGRITGI